MDSKEIVITNDVTIVRILVKFIIAVLCVVGAWMIIHQEMNVALIVTVFLAFIFPLTWCVVWLNTFKIIIDGNNIVVKKYFLKRKFAVNDCLDARLKIVYTNFIHSEKLIVRSKLCRFSVDNNMKNYNLFLDYIKANLPSDKIEVKKIDKRT